jgi:hypothetical protein
VTFEIEHLTGQPHRVVLPWAQVNNHRLTLSYRPTSEADEQALLALLPEGEITDLDQLPQTLPGHSISLTPEIKLNGEIILTGPSAVDAFTLEAMLAFEVQQVIGNATGVQPSLSLSRRARPADIMARLIMAKASRMSRVKAAITTVAVLSPARMWARVSRMPPMQISSRTRPPIRRRMRAI